MPMQDFRKFLPFNDGGDESQDDAITENGFGITNGQYNHDMAVSKRRGFVSLGGTAIRSGLQPSALVGDGTALSVPFLGGELPTSVAGGVEPISTPRLQSDFPLVRSTVFRHTNQRSAVSSSCAVLFQYLCVATAFDAGNIEIVIVEIPTGQVLYRSYLDPGTFLYSDRFINPAVVVVGTKFFVYGYYATTNIIRYHSIDIATMAAAFGTVATTSATRTNYAVRQDSTGVLFAYSNTTANRLTVAHATDGHTLTASVVDAGITDADNLALLRSVENADIGKVHVVYSRTGGGVRYARYDGALSARDLGPNDFLAAGTVYGPVGIAYPNHTTNLYLLAINNSASGSKTHVRAGQVPADYSSSPAPATYSYNTALTQPWGMTAGVKNSSGSFAAATTPSRAFAVLAQSCGYDDGFFDPRPDIQSAHVCMLGVLANGGAELTFGVGGAAAPNAFDAPRAFPVTMALSDGARVASSTYNLPDVVYNPGSSHDYYAPLLRLIAQDGDLAAVSTTSAPVYQAEVVKFTPRWSDGSVAPNKAVASGAAYVAGSMLSLFDGDQYAEDCPLWAPIPIVPFADAGGGPAAGDYSYQAHWAWEDAQGQAHRGPVSTLHTETTVTGGMQVAFVGVLPSRTDCAGNVNLRRFRLEVYRTVKSGAEFHLNKVLYLQPDAAPPTLSYTDTMLDATLIKNRLLYTDGGVLQSEPPPALSAVCLHQDRLFGISAEDPHTIWFTKVKEEGFGFEWNGALTLRLEQAVPVALASLDDKLLVCSADDTWAVVGEGPDSTGARSFNPPERVAQGVGASGPNAVLVMPFGAVMHGPNGFNLLGRDLSVTAVPQAMDTVADEDTAIVASRAFPIVQQGWFLVGGSLIVVFGWERNRVRYHRITLTNASAYDVDQDYLGRPTILVEDTNGAGNDTDVFKLYRLTSTSNSPDHTAAGYDDLGNFVPLVVETGWFRPEGPGFGDSRFRVLHIYGNSPDVASNLKVDIYLQGEQRSLNTVETVTFSAAELQRTNPGHVRYRLKRQRGSAARVVLTQVVDGSNVNALGFVPFGIEWEGAVRGTSIKVGGTSTGPG